MLEVRLVTGDSTVGWNGHHDAAMTTQRDRCVDVVLVEDVATGVQFLLANLGL